MTDHHHRRRCGYRRDNGQCDRRGPAARRDTTLAVCRWYRDRHF